jgi:ubiquitin-conjugating enzyme E2 O
VIAVKHSVYAVAWLAVNQKVCQCLPARFFCKPHIFELDASLAEKKKRPQRFWSGQDIGKLTLIRGRSDLEMRVGDRVHLNNVTGLPSTQHGREGESAGIVHVQAFLVVETETSLDVLWQNGVHETLKSTDVIPYLNPDEYDCW